MPAKPCEGCAEERHERRWPVSPRGHRGCDRPSCRRCLATGWRSGPGRSRSDLLKVSLRSLPPWDPQAERYMHSGCDRVDCPVCIATCGAEPLPSPGVIAQAQRIVKLRELMGRAQLRRARQPLPPRREGAKSKRASLATESRGLNAPAGPGASARAKGPARERTLDPWRPEPRPDPGFDPVPPEPESEEDWPRVHTRCPPLTEPGSGGTFVVLGPSETLRRRRSGEASPLAESLVDASGSAATLDGGVAAAVRPIIENYMRCVDVPNLSLAIADRQGRIVHCHGYTYLEAYRGGDPVQYTTPWSIFRLASVSKWLTTIGVMQLVEAWDDALDADPLSKGERHPRASAIEDGPSLRPDEPGPDFSSPDSSSLDLHVAPILALSFPIWNSTLTDPDGRYAEQLRVRHLLCHQGGWVREPFELYDLPENDILGDWRGAVKAYESGLLVENRDEDAFATDPTGQDWHLFSNGRSPTLPVDLDLLREEVNNHPTWGQLLAPGQGGFYSNWGFLLAGKVLEAWSGVDYESYIRSFVGGPVGATTIQFGHETDRLPGEVDYYCQDRLEATRGCSPDPHRDGSHRRLVRGRDLMTAPSYDVDLREFELNCVRVPEGGYVMGRRPGMSSLTASALDLILVASDLANPSASKLLSEESILAMAQPQGTSMGWGNTAYGLGWDSTGTHLYKTGRQEGTRTILAIHQLGGELTVGTSGIPGWLMRWYSGLSVVILTNADPPRTCGEEEARVKFSVDPDSQTITRHVTSVEKCDKSAADVDITDLYSAIIGAITALGRRGDTEPPWVEGTMGYDLRAELLAGRP